MTRYVTLAVLSAAMLGGHSTLRAQTSHNDNPRYAVYPLAGVVVRPSFALAGGLRLVRRTAKFDLPYITAEVLYQNDSALLAGAGFNVRRAGAFAGASLMYATGEELLDRVPALSAHVGFRSGWGLLVEGRVLRLDDPVVSIQAGFALR